MSVSPVLPDPVQSLLTFGVNIFPSNNSHEYVDLPDKVSSTLCVCCVCELTCLCGTWWVCTYMCMCMYVYVLLLYMYKCFNVIRCIQHLWLLAKLPVLASHMTLICTNGVTCLLHVFCIPHKMKGSALDM